MAAVNKDPFGLESAEYTKKALVESAWFKEYKDVLSEKLEDGHVYTRGQAESIIKKSLAGGDVAKPAAKRSGRGRKKKD